MISTEPYFPTELRGGAEAAARAIADDVLYATVSGPHEQGVALLAAWCHTHYGAPSRSCVEARIDRLVSALEREQLEARLYGGLTGIGWELSHLLRRGWRVDPSALSCIDEVMLAHVRTTPWVRDYDLIYGLVGFGVYALGGAGRPGVAEILAEVVARLAEMASDTGAGLAWHSPEQFLATLPEEQRLAPPLNVGLAHGVAGVVGLLARVVMRNPADACAAALLVGATRWLMSVRDPECGAFPAWSANARPVLAPAWCYGSPGIAPALWAAASALGDASLLAQARAVAVRGHDRALATGEEYELGFCHGLAGAGHVLGRFFQATGDESAREASVFYLQRLLAARREGVGFGGFPILTSPRDPRGRIPDPSILTGAVGMALVLLSAVDPGNAGAWDDLFLCEPFPA
jgi:hypothetical protein